MEAWQGDQGKGIEANLPRERPSYCSDPKRGPDSGISQGRIPSHFLLRYSQLKSEMLGDEQRKDKKLS